MNASKNNINSSTMTGSHKDYKIEIEKKKLHIQKELDYKENLKV
jgi:hypothetical protein